MNKDNLIAKIGRQLKKYFYLKLCMGRMHSYVDLPLDLMKDFMIFSTWLSVTLGGVNNKAMIIGFSILIVILTILGHYEIKFRFAHIQQSVNNQINPELIAIYENTKKNKKI